MDYPQRAYEHIRHLSETIGGRGSCTPDQRRAAEYAHEQLRAAHVSKVEYESFNGVASTYLPFALAFSSALLGSWVALLIENRTALIAGAGLNLLGAWAMYAESDFSANWTRWIRPTTKTKNVVGVMPPQSEAKQQVVLCAHLDTHRTPIFYSSINWQKAFGFLVTGTFLSMALGALTFGLAGLISLSWLHWAGLLFGAIQIFVLALIVSADFTPFSPGANDNASGVGVILALAERLQHEPLINTKINIVLTDCEETGAYGMIAYLDRHTDRLGKEAIYIILDEVGAGHLKVTSADGLIRKHKTHPRALELAHFAEVGLARRVMSEAGQAYTDALPATKRGLIALAVTSAFPDPGVAMSHWHQMSDRLEYIDQQTLQDAHTFTWNILQAIDQA